MHVLFYYRDFDGNVKGSTAEVKEERRMVLRAEPRHIRLWQACVVGAELASRARCAA